MLAHLLDRLVRVALLRIADDPEALAGNTVVNHGCSGLWYRGARR